MSMTAERAREHAIVTVAYVNEPKGKAVSGSIKDANGDYYGVHRSGLHLFAQGRAYEFDFTTNGAGFRDVDVKSVQPIGPHPAPAQHGGNVTNYPSQVAARRDGGQQQRTAPVQQQTAPQNGNGNYYKPVSPKEARRMFICSQMNALITSRQIVPLNAQTIAEAIAMLAEAYDATLGQEDAAG